MSESPTPPVSGVPTWAPPPAQVKPGPAPGIEYAGFWVRTLAYIIDAIPFLVVSIVFVFGPMWAAMLDIVVSVPLPPPDALPGSPEYLAYERLLMERLNESMGDLYATFWLLQLFPIVYFIGFWTWLGRTPGMMPFGLRIARETDGTKPGLARSVLRYVGYIISWIALFIGFIWVAFDGRKQGWHDKLAGTVVVRTSG